MKTLVLTLALAFAFAACELVSPVDDDNAACPCGDGFRCCSDDTCAADGEPCGLTLGVQHATCSTPLTAPVPEVPQINLDASGRPFFDYWRDVPGNLTEAWTCNPSQGLWCDEAVTNTEGCMVFSATGDGFCASFDGDLTCDGEGEIMTWDGGCWACVKIEAHASLCARGVEGVDCRAWPFPNDGAPLTACAQHTDCEDGLICGPAAGGGYALCQCPESFGSNLLPNPSCSYDFQTP